MNVLILGSGGREHAFAYKLKESKRINKIFVAPGNAGTSHISNNIDIEVCDFEKIKKVVIKNEINLVVVGSEDPLVKGIVDFFMKDEYLKNIAIIGPDKIAAQLEGSKEFAKKFMFKNNIPTAGYKSFNKNNIEEGIGFLETLKSPYVLKADGLAGGKGVLILDDIDEARRELRIMLEENKFGNASNTVVIEEFLDGIELSVFVITDGKNYKILPEAKDYKRIGEGNIGLNTGGMGAISPVPFADEDFMKKVENKIIKPTIQGIINEKFHYKGFIFFGLIKVGDEPLVIEYNVRMGDPETEIVIPRLESDLLDIFIRTWEGKLDDIEIKISNKKGATVILVSGGYPESFDRGYQIKGLDNIDQHSLVFHSGTKYQEGEIFTNGGRVLAISSLDNTLKGALDKSYENISKIDYHKKYFRKDIGFEFY